jgi:hemolysin III
MNKTKTYLFEKQTTGEEIANSITHGVGVLLSLAATIFLIVPNALEGAFLKIIVFSIFGFSLFTLYISSTLYHGLTHQGAKRVFHILDHSAIFLLIAGTYTPITLLALQGGWGWALFGTIWILAVIGVCATALFFENARYFNLVLYIAMGWLVVITGPKLFSSLSFEALFWLIAGGVCYTGGVFFYRAKIKFHHMLWHMCVLLGSTSHVIMMMKI